MSKRSILASWVAVCGFAGLIALALPASGVTYMVATNGTQQAPYDTFINAFSNIQDAVNFATGGDLIQVTNGVYGLTSQISITKGVTVRGVNGAANTIVTRKSGSIRIFYLQDANAVVDGFTITNGNPGAAGGGVYLDGNGTIRNCILVGNTGADRGGQWTVSTAARCATV